jgi:hypothetical protein
MRGDKMEIKQNQIDYLYQMKKNIEINVLKTERNHDIQMNEIAVAMQNTLYEVFENLGLDWNDDFVKVVKNEDK